eukprot:3078811-Pleurochrysis_carterae.AAC.1
MWRSGESCISARFTIERGADLVGLRAVHGSDGAHGILPTHPIRAMQRLTALCLGRIETSHSKSTTPTPSPAFQAAERSSARDARARADVGAPPPFALAAATTHAHPSQERGFAAHGKLEASEAAKSRLKRCVRGWQRASNTGEHAKAQIRGNWRNNRRRHTGRD